MTAIYSEGIHGYDLLKPAGFPDERTLQRLVEKGPDLLPLSGSPRVVVLGREVTLGSGRIDVLAMEPTGRPVLIEVKLRNNAESRRAVVAQLLAYAAALHGSTVEEFERSTLAQHLGGRTLHDAVGELAQAEVADADDFRSNLASALHDGSFRLVLVLDQAPQELVRLVGYLEAVTQGLVIDLVTVTAYEIGDKRVVVPQRVEPERPSRPETPSPQPSANPRSRMGDLVPGLEAFRNEVGSAPLDQRETWHKVLAWAERISTNGLAEISTYFGKRGEIVLLPRLLPERAGLVSIYYWPQGKPQLQLFRSVFDRRAPHSIEAVTTAIDGAEIGKGTMAPRIDQQLLDSLFEAYAESANGKGR